MLKRLLLWMWLATGASAFVAHAEPASQSTGSFWNEGWAFTAYSGVLNDPDKADTHSLMIFADYPRLVWREKIYALSVDKRLGGWRDLAAYEAEATATYHSGSAHYGEGSALVGFRWLKFPWDRWFDTALAYHIGYSYASEIAAFENDTKHPGRHSAHWLPALKMELEFRLPRSERWSLVFLYHHRSGAWGLCADRGTISDYACVGLKYRP